MRRDPTRRGRRRRPRLAALGLGLALALTACGGSPDGEGVASLGGDRARNQAEATADGAAGTASKDPQQAAVDFARCMRRHGIDMPDPRVDEQGRVTMRIGPGPGGGQGAAPDPKKLQAAQQACGNPLGGGDGPGQIDPKARDAMLAYARCMRAKGVDVPDPTGDGMVLRRGEGPDPTSAEFEEADRACNHHLSTLGTPERASPEVGP